MSLLTVLTVSLKEEIRGFTNNMFVNKYYGTNYNSFAINKITFSQ